MRNLLLKLLPAPNIAAVLLILGSILGTVFTFGMQYWGADIQREDAIETSGDFESYRIIYGYGRLRGSNQINEITINLVGCEPVSIDGACVTEGLIDRLDAIEEGTKLQLLVHPNSGTVWELKDGEETILDFEYSKQHIKLENTIFAYLGGFMYFCALAGLISLVMRIFE